MPPSVWIGLAVFLIALLAGAALAVVRGLEARRAFRHLGGAVDAATSTLLEAASRVEERANALQQGAPRLQQSVDRLRESTAVLQIELRVLQNARAPLTRFRAAAVPRK
jgi:hypothetical protein